MSKKSSKHTNMVGQNNNMNYKNLTPPPSMVASMKTKAFGIVAVVALLGAIGLCGVSAVNYHGLGAQEGGICKGGDGHTNTV